MQGIAYCHAKKMRDNCLFKKMKLKKAR
jgi:hypothetical protein